MIEERTKREEIPRLGICLRNAEKKKRAQWWTTN